MPLLVRSVQPAIAQEIAKPLEQLESWLAGKTLDDDTLKAVGKESFAASALTKEDSKNALERLWKSRLEFLKADRKAEVDAREIQIGELKMPFWYKIFGDARRAAEVCSFRCTAVAERQRR